MEEIGKFTSKDGRAMQAAFRPLHPAPEIS
jgi:hypothetical protein